MSICKQCFVSGRVQGVFFRASTAHRATELGLNGYARNLADGRVEVLVCGTAESVAELCAWLWEGPPAAEVSEVVVCEMECAEIPSGFTTR